MSATPVHYLYTHLVKPHLACSCGQPSPLTTDAWSDVTCLACLAYAQARMGTMGWRQPSRSIESRHSHRAPYTVFALCPDEIQKHSLGFVVARGYDEPAADGTVQYRRHRGDAMRLRAQLEAADAAAAANGDAVGASVMTAPIGGWSPPRPDVNSGGEVIAHYRHRDADGWRYTQRRIVGGRWEDVSTRDAADGDA